jgi:hypothetical protein
VKTLRWNRPNRPRGVGCPCERHGRTRVQVFEEKCVYSTLREHLGISTDSMGDAHASLEEDLRNGAQYYARLRQLLDGGSLPDGSTYESLMSQASSTCVYVFM